MSPRNRRRAHEGNADLHFQEQSAGDSGVVETDSLLRLKMWRVQQRVAVRLRAYRRRMRARVSAFAERVSEAVARFGYTGAARWLSMKARSIQFSPATVDNMITGVSDGLREFDGEVALNTIFNRAWMLARRYGEGVVTSFSRTPRLLLGESCYLCGDAGHSSFDCHSMWANELVREYGHIVGARRRLLDVRTDERDRADDVERIRVSLSRMEALRRRRLERVFGLLHRGALRVVGRAAGPLLLITRMASLTEQLYYVSVGERVCPAYRPERDLANRLVGTRGLLDFIEGTRKQQVVTTFVAEVAKVKIGGPTPREDTVLLTLRAKVAREKALLNFWATTLDEARLDLATAEAGLRAAPFFPMLSGVQRVMFMADAARGTFMVMTPGVAYHTMSPGTINHIFAGAESTIQNSRSSWRELVEELTEYTGLVETKVEHAAFFLSASLKELARRT